jgi:hypothetical protein
MEAIVGRRRDELLCKLGTSAKRVGFGGGASAMRLWHLLFAILMLGIVFAISRDDVGRVSLIVFVTGFAEFFLGTTAILALFQTFGSLGDARGLAEHTIAIVATILVLIVATVVMNAVLWAGVSLVESVVT